MHCNVLSPFQCAGDFRQQSESGWRGIRYSTIGDGELNEMDAVGLGGVGLVKQVQLCGLLGLQQ